MARPKTVFLQYTGDFTNCMLQLMIAESICPGAEYVTNHFKVARNLQLWGREIRLVDAAPEAEAFMLKGHIGDLPGMAEAFAASGRDLLWVKTCNLSAGAYPPVAAAKALFPDRPSEAMELDPEALVVNVRAGNILAGIHNDYAVTPPSWYRRLQALTDRDLLFFGQIGDDPYSEALRRAFPDARFVPGRGAMADHQTLRRCRRLAVSASTFSAFGAWLSEAERIYFPAYGGFNPFQRRDGNNLMLDDPRYRFFIFPLFYMTSIETALPHLERCAGAFAEITPEALRERMAAEIPRLGLAQALPLLDEDFYLHRSPKVAEHMSKVGAATAREHYAGWGHALGWAPFRFDPIAYSRAYPEAAWEIGNGYYFNCLEHYCLVGRDRGYALPG